MKYIITLLFLCLTSLAQLNAAGTQDKEHTVMCVLQATEGNQEHFKNALVRVAQKSRQEDSCIEYIVCQDQDNPLRFGLYEKWKSKELHQEQFTKPYILAFIEETKEWVETPPTILFAQELKTD